MSTVHIGIGQLSNGVLRRARCARLVVAGSLAAAIGVAAAPPADAAVPCGCTLRDTPIAYVRGVSDGGGAEIFRMNADGSGQTRVTNSPRFDSHPSWSPDHSRIVYATDRHSTTNIANFELHIIDANGLNDRRLTDNPRADTEPAWSPTGDKIAFTSTRDGNAEIYVVNADGTGLRNLTRFFKDDSQPAWSPDGKRIAFIRVAVDGPNLFIMNSDGTGVEQMTHALRTSNPSWSADGSMIAFSSFDSGNMEITVMSSSFGPSSFSRVIRRPGDDTSPTWSPDGRIAFSNGGNIRVMRPDGAGDAVLTTNASRPQWARVPSGVLSS